MSLGLPSFLTFSALVGTGRSGESGGSLYRYSYYADTMEEMHFPADSDQTDCSWPLNACSPACSSTKPVQGAGEQTSDMLTWSEDGLDPVDRAYSYYIPTSYKPGSPTPLVLVFHGWGGKGTDYHRSYGFGGMAERHGFIAVYPDGMGDCSRNGCRGFTSWNGAGTTGSDDQRQSCDASAQPYNYCYDSCQTKFGSCHRCDWTTCYDDIGFVRSLVAAVEDKFCVDRRRLYAYGCSNGGIFTHALAQKLPGYFAAIVAGCGGRAQMGWGGIDEYPPLGDGTGRPPLSVLLIQGRRDKTLPLNGVATDGFRYTPRKDAVDTYLTYNGCSLEQDPRLFATNFSSKQTVCVARGYGCRGDAMVAHCTFAGGHDLNTATGDDEFKDSPQLTFQFFKATAMSLEWCDFSARTPMTQPAELGEEEQPSNQGSLAKTTEETATKATSAQSELNADGITRNRFSWLALLVFVSVGCG